MTPHRDSRCAAVAPLVCVCSSAFREQLMEARRIEALPTALRDSVADLEVEVARLQSVTDGPSRA